MADSLLYEVTNAGFAACVNASNNGLQATITHIAVGKGQVQGAGFIGYTPQRTATALKNETGRFPLLSGVALGQGAGFRVLAQVPSSSTPAEYVIQEMAAILSDGTVFAIWSDPDHPLAGKTPRTDVDISLDVILDAIPAGSLAITVLEPDIPDTLAAIFGNISTNADLFIAAIAAEQRAVAHGIT